MTSQNLRLQHCPSGRTPFVVPSTARKKLKIVCDLLQPPVIVNLREDPVDEHWRFQLSEQELNYFKHNGNNVTLFIHGFNVGYGEFSNHIIGAQGHTVGRVPDAYHLPVYHETSKATVWRDLKIVKKRFPEIDFIPATQLEKLNGTAGHSWITNFEKSMNEACGFDIYGDDYSKFTRMVYVMWSGDVFPVNYMQAELNATIAGGRLVPLLKQLIKHGLKINIIAHSLGNRALLVALNELGKKSITTEKIQNAFMWQPAIPDTALSTNPDLDTSVMQNWQLPHAYKGAKKITVLHSENDNVIGKSSLAKTWEDCADGEDGRSDTTECAVGLAQLSGLAEMDGLYGAASRGAKINSSIGPVPISIDINTGVPAQDANGTLFFNQERWRKGWEALAKRQKKAFDEAMRDCDSPYAYICGIEGAQKGKFYNPRPAMGYHGPYTTTDEHMQQLVRQAKVEIINQKEWLFDHSGMKIPTPELFKNVIKKVIMTDNIKKTTGFGRY